MLIITKTKGVKSKLQSKKNIILTAYLCFRAPLIPLLFLTAAVSAVWDELSVYELPRKNKKIISTMLNK